MCPSWLQFAAKHKGLIFITAGWLAACGAGLTLIERLVWHPLGYSELAFEIIELFCYVIAASAVALVLLRRSIRRNTGVESTLLDEVQETNSRCSCWRGRLKARATAS